MWQAWLLSPKEMLFVAFTWGSVLPLLHGKCSLLPPKQKGLCGPGGGGDGTGFAWQGHRLSSCSQLASVNGLPVSMDIPEATCPRDPPWTPSEMGGPDQLSGHLPATSCLRQPGGAPPLLRPRPSGSERKFPRKLSCEEDIMSHRDMQRPPLLHPSSHKEGKGVSLAPQSPVALIPPSSLHGVLLSPHTPVSH